MKTLTRKSLLPLVVLLLLPLGANAWAIESGWALWGGIDALDIKEVELNSATGTTIGGDYQWVGGKKLSVNPYLTYSTHTPNDTAGSSKIELDITTTAFGVEGRLWSRDLFNLSLRLASYSVETKVSGGTTESHSGIGYGIGQGFEAHSGFLIQGRYDQANINENTFKWLRLLVGWRF